MQKLICSDTEADLIDPKVVFYLVSTGWTTHEDVKPTIPVFLPSMMQLTIHVHQIARNAQFLCLTDHP